MAIQLLDTTSGAGDTAKAGGDKINAMFGEMYGAGASDTMLRAVRRSADLASRTPRRHTSQPWNAPALWVGNQVVVTGYRSVNGGNIYVYSKSGTTAASGGPTGTGPDLIADGTANCYYVGPAFATDPNAPTYSVSTTAPTLGRFYRPAAGNFTSGAAVVVSNDNWFDAWGTAAGPSTGMSGEFTKGGTAGFGFVTDSLQVCIPQPNANGPYAPTVEVDGRLLVDGAILQASTSGTTYLVITFATRAHRRIIWRAPGPDTFTVAKGVYCEATATVWRGALTSPLKGLLAGDSFSVDTQGYYSELNDRGIGSTAFGELGIDNVFVNGEGGTGFVAGGTNSSYSAATRIGYINTVKPDVVMAMSSVNDNGQTQAAITTAFQSWYAAVRAAVPNALIFITGQMSRETAETAVDSAIRQAIVAINDRKLIFLPASGDPGGAWCNGTGKASDPKGDGNGDRYVSADGLHPTARGTNYLGRRAGAAARMAITKP